ncbi:MAG: diacylglycerol kinase [Patescibacteria group bacterium]|nr:diacylglycerol kinase [Patescibacteria group bacterium]
MVKKPRFSRSAGGIVLNPEGKVLVVNQNGDSWSLPKGHIEEGEDAFTAAKREIGEESGITELKLIRDLGKYKRFKIGRNGGEDRTEEKEISMFLFETGQSALKPVDPENPEAGWVDKDDVARLLTHPKDKEFFTKMASADFDPKDAFSIEKRVKSFAHAGRGISVFMRSTHNAWIHAAILAAVVALGIYFDITELEWLMIVLAAGLVFSAEAFNTAIEIDIDLTSPEYHPYARDTKDVAAGAVLISAIAAAVTGALIFIPRIF